MDNKKGFKAFKKGLICKSKQYVENTVFEEDEAIPCEKGMHYCNNPLDTLNYYDLIDDDGNITEFANVESLEEPIIENNKCVTKKLKIGAKLNLMGLSVAIPYKTGCCIAGGDWDKVMDIIIDNCVDIDVAIYKL